jgi:hypothetical protein
MTGGEDLNGLGAALMQSVQQAGVQALLKEDVGRYTGLHHFLRYSSGAIEGGGERGID